MKTNNWTPPVQNVNEAKNVGVDTPVLAVLVSSRNSAYIIPSLTVLFLKKVSPVPQNET